MRDEVYVSGLAADIEAFVSLKRACGFPYVESARILRRFDRMVAERFPDATCVTREACDAWVALVEGERPNELLRRVSPVRQLARYLTAAGRPSHVIAPGTPARGGRYVPHIFTSAELAAFFRAVDSCPPSAYSPTRRYVVPTIFRLLYCCGLRSSEALLLRASDVDLGSGRILVRGSKGWAARTVYAGDDMLRVLRSYDARVGAMMPGRAPLFPNRDGGFFSKGTPDRWFHEFWDPLPEAALATGNPPRVHDLRHTFAVRRIDGWVEEGADVEAMYPYLSGYLGHAHFADTDYYLRMSAAFRPTLEALMDGVDGAVLPEVAHGEED